MEQATSPNMKPLKLEVGKVEKKDIKEDFPMDFPAAMKKIIEGKRIYSKDWKDTNYFGILKDGRLKLHKPDDKYYDWIISDGDLEATDWFVL